MATITCPYCGTRSHMTSRAGSGVMVSESPFVVSVAFSCDECHRLLSATAETRFVQPGFRNAAQFEKALTDGSDGEETWKWEPKTVLGKDFPDVPTHIASPASEAFQCLSIGANRAAVLLARSVIEASAKDKSVSTGSLYEKIDKLAEQGHIRAKLASAAHEVRLAGNDMAHGDFATAEITAVDAEEVLGLMEDFLRELFELDTRVARRQAKRATP